MNKQRSLLRILLATITTFLLTSTVYASYTISETGSNFTRTGPMWDSISTGLYGHAYQSLQDTYQQNDPASGSWFVNSGEPSGQYHWWAYIPLNGGTYDAIIDYQLKPTSVTKVINQENYANTWVYLGTISGNSSSYVRMDNGCVGGQACDWTRQVWWDDLLFHRD